MILISIVTSEKRQTAPKKTNIKNATSTPSTTSTQNGSETSEQNATAATFIKKGRPVKKAITRKKILRTQSSPLAVAPPKIPTIQRTGSTVMAEGNLDASQQTPPTTPPLEPAKPRIPQIVNE